MKTHPKTQGLLLRRTRHGKNSLFIFWWSGLFVPPSQIFRRDNKIHILKETVPGIVQLTNAQPFNALGFPNYVLINFFSSRERAPLLVALGDVVSCL